MLIAMGVGTVGLHAYPVERTNVYLQILNCGIPRRFWCWCTGTRRCGFTTPFFAASILGSLTAIVAYHVDRRAPDNWRLRHMYRRSSDRHRCWFSENVILRRRMAGRRSRRG